ncbi:MazE family transcriptional regulator [Deinococcus frigens]|uniref:AbrB/MazE/SpoVT family DNA-binding domain-containing protein n=1 Tax=Deinococcus frigens TaxID=249403 RepID=UPI000496BC62|nr:MazE family transcriptional regulator [Deinococcus frigens]
MRVKIRKQGNSLGFVVPASIVQAAELKVGLEYELQIDGQGGLYFKPAVVNGWVPDMSVDELLAGLPDGPLHYEDLPEYVPMGRELDW